MVRLMRSFYFVLALAFGPGAEAALYKWVDAEGNVSYSDKPPPEVNAEEVKQYSSGISAEESQQKLDEITDKADAQQKDRELKDDIAKQQTERDVTIKKNCDIARKNKSLLETTARVTLKDEDGNDYFLEDDQREAKLADANAQVQRYCN